MRGKRHGALLLIGALSGVLSASLAVGQSVNDVLQAEQKRIKQAQAEQDQIDKIAAQTRSKFDEYQRVLKDIDGLVVYNNVQQNLIDDQNQQLDDLRSSIDEVSVIERQILPLMIRMISGLQQFVELDVPFLKDEREERVASLRELVNRSDVTTAEKFRNVMEAWQIEIDYGRTAETYTAELSLNGAEREVNFLRIGRVALLYLTPDGKTAGVWDQASRSWQPLSGDYIDSIRKGLEVVRQTGQPEMFMIPVPAPEEG